MTEYKEHYEHLLHMVDDYQGDKNAINGAKLFDEMFEYFHQHIPLQLEHDLDVVRKVIGKNNPDLKTLIDDIPPYAFLMGLIKRMLVSHNFPIDSMLSVNFGNFNINYGRSIKKAISIT